MLSQTVNQFPRLLLIGFFLVSLPAVGQDPSAVSPKFSSPLDSKSDKQLELIQKLRSADDQVSRDAAEEIVEQISGEVKDDSAGNLRALASAVFRYGRDRKQRGRAFAYLRKHFPIELEGVTRTIEITTPNYPCVGSFQDSVRKTLYNGQGDVWLVTIIRRRVAKSETNEPIGDAGVNEILDWRRIPTELVLNVVVSHDVTERDILETLQQKNGYDMGKWTVLQRVSVADALAR